jgi:hypothetical protein
MPTIQRGLKAEDAEKGDAPIGRQVSFNEHLDASRVEKTGTSRSPPEPRRWVPHRKAEVVAAVRGGLISLAEARNRYALSLEEYLTWQREIDRFGLAGLRVYRTRQPGGAGSLSTDQ